MNTKNCSRCETVKPLEAFHKNKRNKTHGRASFCAECAKLRGQSETKRRSWLRKNYGITLEQFDTLKSIGGMTCPICLRLMVATSRPVTARMVCIDHDHKSGKVRGLLCHSCNKAIGILGDDLASLLRATTYLQSPPAWDAIYP